MESVTIIGNDHFCTVTGVYTLVLNHRSGAKLSKKLWFSHNSFYVGGVVPKPHTSSRNLAIVSVWPGGNGRR